MASSPSKTSNFEIGKFSKRLDSLISQWEEEVSATKVRREVRKKEVNVEEMRKAGDIPQNGTFIARRVIDRNIRQEKPEYIAYISQAPRLVLFKSRTDLVKDTTSLADWFAQGMKYRAWEVPWHQLFDGTSLHGACFIEVRFDDSKPFDLELRYTPRECLIFPRKLKGSVQRCETLLRVYEYLPNELEDFVDSFEFDKEVVDEITKSQKESQRDDPIKVYKVFTRKDLSVHVGWYTPDCKRKWLKPFEPLDSGMYSVVEDEDGKPSVKPLPASDFPFFEAVYEIIEEEEILNVKGRAARDLGDQDALSHIWTSTVNGCTNASDIQASVVNNAANMEGSQAEPIKPNTIHPRQLEFWQAQWPDAMMLQVAQALSIENMAGAGKMDFVVSNRKDARKTAKEMGMAEEQSAKLTSINITPAANCIVNTYTYCWEIVHNRVIVGLLEAPPELSDFFQDTYDLLPAGDTEVIKRAEEIGNLQQDIPLLQPTPLYGEVLARYVELRYPDHAVRWKVMLQQGMDLRPVVMQMLQIISQVPISVFSPEQQAQIQQVMQSANQLLVSNGGMAGGASNMAQPAGNAPASSQPAPVQRGSNQQS